MDRPASPPTINYAPPERGRGRAWFVRPIIGILLFFAAFHVRNWPKDFYDHLRIEYLMNRCLHHPTSPGVLVYSTSSPSRSITQPYAVSLVDEFPGNQTMSLWEPRPYLALPLAGTADESTIFVGQLQSRNGLRRLVVVHASIDPTEKDGEAGSSILAYVFDPNSTNSAKATISLLRELLVPVKPSSSLDAKFYSAAADPADAAHIQFHCFVYGEEWYIDGTLRNDGSLGLTSSRIQPY